MRKIPAGKLCRWALLGACSAAMAQAQGTSQNTAPQQSAAQQARAQQQQAQAAAGEALTPELIANLQKIREAAMASDYAWRELAHLTENIGPRLAGSPQALQASNYVADEMRKLGLEVNLERVTVPHWVRGEERGELTVFAGQAPRTTQKIVLTALGNSAATRADGITAEVVAVNNFAELAALGREKVSGRIVLYNEKFDARMAAQGEAFLAYGPAVEYRIRGAQEAQKLGAVASLIRSVGDADFRLPHTGTSIAAGIPAAAVTAEDAELIADLTKQGRVVMHLVLTPQTLPDTTGYNVIADLKGSEHPEQVVVVSGHLDSWDLGTGAIDDGAGVVVAMQVANLCKQLSLRPRRTIRVIAWMDEENRGSGSTAYAAEYKGEFANYAAAFESDSGAGHPMGFSGNANTRAITEMQAIAALLGPIGATGVQNNGEGGADIGVMGQAGVPVFGLWQDGRTYFHYHHSPADTLDKVNPHELQENAAALAVMAYAIADLPEMLPRQQ
ncbi:MAG TPA: M20/M25/M40 family metallo-hydrolase [Candidatus Acidoferrales bacterium]|nr:M20/M25/M40 family metallo-hydrolase [Candidatus Acidoferrales bacterium]